MLHVNCFLTGTAVLEREPRSDAMNGTDFEG
jgi:hypothetical protein